MGQIKKRLEQAEKFANRDRKKKELEKPFYKFTEEVRQQFSERKYRIIIREEIDEEIDEEIVADTQELDEEQQNNDEFPIYAACEDTPILRQRLNRDTL